MTDIIIAGIGQTSVGELWDLSLRELAFKAIETAIIDSGRLRPQALFVGNMLSQNLSQQAHLGTLLVDFAGLRFDDDQLSTGIEAATIEAGGASGGAALRQGYLAVKSGLVDVVLVVGVEKFTDCIGSGVEAALATTSDGDFESIHGLTPTAQAALLMRRYLHEFDVPPDGLAGFILTAHSNGACNPNAMFQKAIKLETYRKAEMVSEPLNVFDIAPNADGAAALILTRSDLLPPDFPHPRVRISGSAAACDGLALHDRRDPLWFEAAQLSAWKAIKQAGITLAQISLFEYHDSTSIHAALSLEAVGFAKRGMGWKLAQNGDTALNGKIPCATFGGLKARGNPGGATGVYQAVEAVTQLRYQAGANQVRGARYALIQSLGGPASTSFTHILERME